MNPPNPDPNDAALNRALREWEVKTPPPPRFQENVWRRLEKREQDDSVWELLRRRLTAAFARPSMAVSYVVALLLAGSLAGYWQARATRMRVDENMGARYVQMLDPYQRMHH